MGFAKWYVREALKHCQPGDVAGAVATLSSWAAENPAVRMQSDSAVLATGSGAPSVQPAAAADASAASSQVMLRLRPCRNVSVWCFSVLGVHQRQGFKPLAVQAQATAAAAELAAATSSAMAAPPPLPKSPEDSADHETEAVRLRDGTANPPSTMSLNAVAQIAACCSAAIESCCATGGGIADGSRLPLGV